MATTNAQNQTTKPASTRPSRARGAATKATTPAAKPAEKVDVTAEATVAEAPTTPAANALKLVLEHTGTTKRYEVFEPDSDAQKAGTVGKLYFPLGTKVVKVLATE